VLERILQDVLAAVSVEDGGDLVGLNTQQQDGTDHEALLLQ
jgi:hypothetical protein